jgi:hypothetical protein
VTWDDSQAERAAELLRQFNGREEVCAVLECADDDLDALCRDAFGMGFDEASAHFAAQGRAGLCRARRRPLHAPCARQAVPGTELRLHDLPPAVPGKGDDAL